MTGYQNHGYQDCTHGRLKALKRNLSKWLKYLVLTIGLFICGCREQIVHNLTEPELNKVLTRLQEISIHAYREKQPDGNWAIAVDSNDALLAIQHLEESHTFRPKKSAKDNRSSVLSSREEQRFLYERDLSQTIEATLLSIDGVLDARVHLNLPAVDPLFGQPISKALGSASVLLIVSNQFLLDRAQIAQLVSGASGIEIKGVTVLLSQNTNAKAEVKQLSIYAERANSGWLKKISALFDADKIGVEVGLSLLILGIGGVYLGLTKFRKRKHVICDAI